MVTLQEPRIRGYIEDLAGEEGLEVAELLQKMGRVVDSDLAEALEWKPSAVRKVLYKLYEGRAAEYLRDRDKETGYETFIWSLNLRDALHAIQLRQQKQIEDLQEQVHFEEEHRFYLCEECGTRYLFEDASEADFQCPEDGATLEFDENEPLIEQLRERIGEMEGELEEIQALVEEAEEEAEVERARKRREAKERAAEEAAKQKAEEE